MARRRKRRTLKPRVPKRVKKKRRSTKTRGHQHPELIGLGLVALGIFLGSVIWAGWNGGYVGHWIGDGVYAVLGLAALALPAVLVVIGGLMVARSDLVDVRPFRTGLVVLSLGLLLVLGSSSGGYLGMAVGGGLGLAIGGTGVLIVGVLALLAGALLVTGASAGAIVRGSGRAVHRAARRSFQREAPPLRVIEGAAEPPKPQAPPVDVVNEFPELVSESEPPPLLVPNREPAEEPDQGSLFDVTAEPAPDYHLPDRGLLRQSPPGGGPNGEHSARVADALVQTLANFGVDATVVGTISGPRVTRYELPLAPGTKVAKVAGLKDDLSYALATPEMRILPPIPGKQAVGVELPNTSPNLVTLGDIFDDLPQTASPLAVWLGKDISGQAVWTDLARMPHVLIAGTTGSGKSGCINTILTSVLLRSSPA